MTNGIANGIRKPAIGNINGRNGLFSSVFAVISHCEFTVWTLQVVEWDKMEFDSVSRELKKALL